MNYRIYYTAMKKNIDTKKVSFLSEKELNPHNFPENPEIYGNKTLVRIIQKTLLPFLFILFTFIVDSQEKLTETCQIVSNPENVNLENYIVALNTSNFECFRFETKSRMLVFKSGVVVELFSYKQVTDAGFPQINNCYLLDSVKEVQYELELVGNQIAIRAPYDPSVKRVQQ